MRDRLRKLHFEGREFTWKADIRAGPGADGRRRRFIRVRVWGAGKTGCALQADLMEAPDPAQHQAGVGGTTPASTNPRSGDRDGDRGGDGRDGDGRDGDGRDGDGEAASADEDRPIQATAEEATYAYPSAAIVLQLVAYGLAAGWTPDKVGGMFRVSSAAAPTLPGLRVVDGF